MASAKKSTSWSRPSPTSTSKSGLTRQQLLTRTHELEAALEKTAHDLRRCNQELEREHDCKRECQPEQALGKCPQTLQQIFSQSGVCFEQSRSFGTVDSIPMLRG